MFMDILFNRKTQHTEMHNSQCEENTWKIITKNVFILTLYIHKTHLRKYN